MSVLVRLSWARPSQREAMAFVPPVSTRPHEVQLGTFPGMVHGPCLGSGSYITDEHWDRKV